MLILAFEPPKHTFEIAFLKKIRARTVYYKIFLSSEQDSGPEDPSFEELEKKSYNIIQLVWAYLM